MFGWLLHVSVFTLMVVVYYRSAGDPSAPLILSLPPSAAVMLYLLWPAPFIYVSFWVIGFRRFVFSDEDEANYEALLARRAPDASDRDSTTEELP